jgi:hypothetical protein
MKWCDLTCEYASFPTVTAVDGAGSCRTFKALNCARLNRLVHQNGPCQCQEADHAGQQQPRNSPDRPSPA